VYVVDASVWVSHLVSTDSYHPASQEWLERQVARLEVVASPAILLAEVGGAVARRTGDSQLGTQALALMQRLPNLQVLEIDATFARFSADLAADLRLRGADAMHVALAQRLDIPLITWDREQLHRGLAAVSALTPDAALG
jgi:predicted nucleic acid-binding protein